MIHAHVAAQAYVEARRRMLTRRCPNCGLNQLTPEDQIHAPVPCSRCGNPINPKVSNQRDDNEYKN